MACLSHHGQGSLSLTFWLSLLGLLARSHGGAYVGLQTLGPDRFVGYGLAYRTTGIERIATIPVGYAGTLALQLSLFS